MPRFKLQVRIIILIAGLSFLLISVFTYIQLQNAREQLLVVNKWQSRAGTLFFNQFLKIFLRDIQTERVLPGILESAIASFHRLGMVEKVSIMTMDGRPIATNDPIVGKYGETKKDIETYLKLSDKSNPDTLFYQVVNKKNNSLDTYTPLNIAAGSYMMKLSFSIAENVRQAVSKVILPVTLTGLAVILLNIFLGFVLIKTVVVPIKQLDEATRDIASGNLDRRVNIRTSDEIEVLGATFNTMTIALKRMKEIAENANPLTGLPGNNIIREEVEERIKNKEKFLAIHVDLDNFKAYNDRYGIAKGDEVIKFTSECLQKALKEHSSGHDFMGHEGGDDFFVITRPEKGQEIADAIISEFDLNIVNFYNEEDKHQGYIIAQDRQGSVTKFPLMTVSLAGVSTKSSPIGSYGELTNIAVGVKHKAKNEKRSIFYLDQRRA